MPAERLAEPSLENVPRVPSRDAEGVAWVSDVAREGWNLKSSFPRLE